MIHKYKMNDFNILLDVNSGAVHSVDDVVFDIVDRCENGCPDAKALSVGKYSPEEIEEAISEIIALKNEGLLFSPDISEAALPQVAARNPVVKALCLHVAHDCNLKCGYCFAEEGEYGGKRSLMSAEVGKAAIDFLIENSGGRTNLEVDFFGGEPLMNFKVVKEIVAYGRSREKESGKKFRFTLTTNGVLLNEEIQAYLNENMSNVVLSLDGRPEVNDRMRKLGGGKSSYELVADKFRRLAESRGQKNYYVRGTFTRHNLDFAKDVEHLAELGFKNISVEPVVGSEETDYSIREQELPEIFAEYERLAADMVDKDYDFFHFMIDLTGGPCLAKRLVGCGAGTEYLAVTPEGDLYPCHQFVGNEAFKMGTLADGVTDRNRRQEFEECNVYAKKECRECFAKFYCSGGCAANAYQTEGDILSPSKINCEMQRKRVECAIMLKAAQSAKQI